MDYRSRVMCVNDAMGFVKWSCEVYECLLCHTRTEDLQEKNTMLTSEPTAFNECIVNFYKTSLLKVWLAGCPAVSYQR